MKKILVLELWGIGDLILMSGVLKALKQKFPNAQVTLLCQEHARTILQENKFVGRFIEYRFPWTRHTGKYKFWQWDWKGLVEVIKKLREESFDVSLDARGDVRNNILAFLIRARRRIGYGWSGGGFFLTDRGEHAYKNEHRVQAWKNLLRFLNINDEDCAPLLSIPGSQRKWVEDFLKQKGIDPNDFLVGIHPGASAKVRCWPMERFAEVAVHIRNNYNAKILVFIEPGGYGNEIPIRGEFLKIEPTLEQLLALVQRLNLLVCNDSGVMHVATAFDTKMMVIYGPGNKTLIGPYKEENSIVMIEDMPCRPCYDYCKFKEPYCLTNISLQSVINQTDRMLGRILC